MGYSTDFEGEFKLDRPLEQSHKLFLEAFANTRRMNRNPNKCPPCPIRDAAGLLPLPQYFVSGTGLCGQDDHPSIINYNSPPNGQPGLWCQWIPNDDGTNIQWDGSEKFYNYVEWIEYIIDHFLKLWKYTLNGTVKYQGEDPSDFVKIEINDNVVKLRQGRRTYE